jgi:hypothetical protein
MRVLVYLEVDGTPCLVFVGGHRSSPRDFFILRRQLKRELVFPRSCRWSGVQSTATAAAPVHVSTIVAPPHVAAATATAAATGDVPFRLPRRTTTVMMVVRVGGVVVVVVVVRMLLLGRVQLS